MKTPSQYMQRLTSIQQELKLIQSQIESNVVNEKYDVLTEFKARMNLLYNEIREIQEVLNYIKNSDVNFTIEEQQTIDWLNSCL